MYNLAEYTLVKRSAYIVEKALERAMTYRSFNQGYMQSLTYSTFPIKENFYEIQKIFEFLIQAIYPGVSIKRFVSINTNISVKAIPITLIEIFEPFHTYVPVTFTQNAVLAISSFGNSVTEEFNKNKYFGEIIPMTILENMTKNDIITVLDKKVTVEDQTFTVQEIIVMLIEQFAIGTNDTDKVLIDNFDIKSALDIQEISVESAIFKHVSERFGVESILELDRAHEEDVISPTDFLPMQIEVDGHSNFVYLNSVKGRLMASRSEGVVDNSIITVKVPESATNTILMELDSCCYFDYDAQLVIEKMDGSIIREELFNWVSLNEDVDYALRSIGTEGFVGSMKDAYTAIKIFGIRKGSILYHVFMNITKLPRKIIGYLWQAIKHALKSRNQLEKEQMLDFQEKLLNDEFDIVLEKIKMLGENSVRSWIWTVLLGPIYFLPFMYILKRNANRQIKLRAIERLEFKIDGLLERHDQKLEYAKNEGDPETVDRLLAEKHNMEFARLKLIEFKRDLVQKDRIRYMTFNKDLSMNGRQRIDALMQSGSYFNIGHSGGKGYTVETRFGGSDF